MCVSARKCDVSQIIIRCHSFGHAGRNTYASRPLHPRTCALTRGRLHLHIHAYTATAPAYKAHVHQDTKDPRHAHMAAARNTYTVHYGITAHGLLTDWGMRRNHRSATKRKQPTITWADAIMKITSSGTCACVCVSVAWRAERVRTRPPCACCARVHTCPKP